MTPGQLRALLDGVDSTLTGKLISGFLAIRGLPSVGERQAAWNHAMVDSHAVGVLASSFGEITGVDSAQILRENALALPQDFGGYGLMMDPTKLKYPPNLPESPEDIEAAAQVLAEQATAEMSRQAAISQMALGVGQYKTWVTRMDDKVRNAHAALEGETVPVDEAFDMDGYSAMYPHDETLPPELSINCRCSLVFSDEPGD